MIRDDVIELLALIDRFTSGEDQSRQAADEIEGIVLECCRDEPWADNVILVLASYAPGGDEHYYDERAAATELAAVAAQLRRDWDEPAG